MTTPKMYADLATWWPLLSAPSEYVEEASIYLQTLRDASATAPRTLLELGSGGGNNAFHFKSALHVTLADLSTAMLDASKKLNPECEHFEGDMRTIRLAKLFDAVFIHDAINYMTSEDDLRAAMETAFVHCRPGGVVLFAPDYVRETFTPGTDCGGNDDAETLRGLRYLEWVWDPDPDDATYIADYVFTLRDEAGDVSIEHDRHIEGLFALPTWLRLMQDVGFKPRHVPVPFPSEDLTLQLFVGNKPA